jgi:hypothetical protein
MAEVRLIDANALMDMYKVECNLANAHRKKGWQGAMQLLYDAPTIDHESLSPKGRWEMRGGKRYCTNCWKRACVTRDTDDFWYTAGTDFCPNCGAKMEV